MQEGSNSTQAHRAQRSTGTGRPCLGKRADYRLYRRTCSAARRRGKKQDGKPYPPPERSQGKP